MEERSLLVTTPAFTVVRTILHDLETMLAEHRGLHNSSAVSSARHILSLVIHKSLLSDVGGSSAHASTRDLLYEYLKPSEDSDNGRIEDLEHLIDDHLMPDVKLSLNPTIGHNMVTAISKVCLIGDCITALLTTVEARN